MEAEVARVNLRSIRALPDQHYVVALGAADRGEPDFEFEFRRALADHGGYEIVAPDRLRYAPGTYSSAGTFLLRIVGLFHRVVAAADVPVLAMAVSESGGEIVLIYQHTDKSVAKLAFRIPVGPLKPAVVVVSDEEAARAASELGLDAETVGRALYAFAMQLRDVIEILVPDDIVGDGP